METFLVISIIAIIWGGLLSASTASHPTRYSVWASAYLVLVVGITQLGLVYYWQRLNISSSALAITALIIFNIGNLIVLFGRFLKQSSHWSLSWITLGSILLAIAVIMLGVNASGTAVTSSLSWYFILLLVILFGAFAGVIMSARPEKLEIGNQS